MILQSSFNKYSTILEVIENNSKFIIIYVKMKNLGKDDVEVNLGRFHLMNRNYIHLIR